jgi:hypothetical protein
MSGLPNLCDPCVLCGEIRGSGLIVLEMILSSPENLRFAVIREISEIRG